MAVIIGIHGLANKPEPATLREYWLDSIKEGLERNLDFAEADVPFEMVYWADAFYARSLHREEEYPFDGLYNKQPYFPAAGSGPLEERPETIWDDLRGVLSGFAGKIIDKAYDFKLLDDASDLVLKRVSFTRDLSLYYENPLIPQRGGGKRRARDILHDRLRAKLAEHRGDRLMLISHSMGTIVAYNVLRDIGRESGADWAGFECPYLVTMGSPLGLGKVKDEIDSHRDYDPEGERLRTPTVVTEDWLNLADPQDPVSVDSKLRDDFGPNRRGVQVRDDLISNSYRYGDPPDDKANRHKSYGYLRTPEMSRHIAGFLGLT